MDMERIKQNLRLRSGRSKKNRKPPPEPQSAPQPPARNEVQSERPQELVRSPTQQYKYSRFTEDPSLRNWDSSTALPQMPGNFPQGKESMDNITTRRPSTRYDRAGIERAPTSPPPPMPEPPVLQRTITDPSAANPYASEVSDAMDFDLRPPAPKPKPLSTESIGEALFSPGHLNTLLHNPKQLARFSGFLNRYKPQYYAVLIRYLETQKAIRAIEYANAVAEGVSFAPEDNISAITKASSAAIIDKSFEESSTSSFKVLVSTALPMYITYNLVKIVSECLLNEITGRQNQVMRNMVGGLSEVFCLTDPTQEDNPIIYASEEFYRLTGYGRDDVIGHNCRFLQGAKTKRESPMRLRESLSKGEETCETLLNYRRDGRPFINLLMIAPLHDDKGNVKYNIGAQVDVSGLVEGGKGLDGFERYLINREMEKRRNEIAKREPVGDDEAKRKKRALTKLRELSEMFDLEESAVVQSHSRSNSMTREGGGRSSGSTERARPPRRVFDDSGPSDGDDGEEAQEKAAWNLGHAGPSGLSGKLPGVYDSYMLIRAAPSLRIIFVSPKLRKIGNVIQSPFLSHIAAPSSTLAGLKESFGTGVPVSAKVNFMPQPGERRDGTKTSQGARHEDGPHGKACWLSATPLLGSDDRIGVWMVVIIEKSRAPRKTPAERPGRAEQAAPREALYGRPGRSTGVDIPTRASSRNTKTEDVPIKPKRLDEIVESSNNVMRHPRNDRQADSPVEEYSEMPQNYEHVPRSVQSPEGSVRSPDTSFNPDNENDEYVQPRPRRTSSLPFQRVHIQPDSDFEPDAPSTSALALASERSPMGRDQSPMGRELGSPPRSPIPPHNFPQSISDMPFEETHENHATPTRANFHDITSHAVPPSNNHGPEANSARASSMLYMDYLRAGNHNSGEYNRAGSVGGFVPIRDRPDDQPQEDLQTPNSVD